jgi:hypothetical protein
MDDEQIVNEEVVNKDESQEEKQVEFANPQQGTQETTEPEETSEQSDESKEETSDESEDEEEAQQPSRREQLRIQSLLKKYGNPEKAEVPRQTPQGMDYAKELNAEPEIIEKLEADRRAAAEKSYTDGLSQADYIRWEMGLRIDTPQVTSKFPILDKNSPEFHPAIADAVNTWYLRMCGFDPQKRTVNDASMSYADFVESYMELVEETATQKNVKTVKNVTKQAASTGLRPDGSSAKRLNLNQAPENMSIEELYAALGQKPPKK